MSWTTTPNEKKPPVQSRDAYWVKGFAVGEAGGMMRSCPYPNETAACKSWTEGFFEGKPKPVIVADKPEADDKTAGSIEADPPTVGI